MAAPHDAPSLAEIIEAVREWLETDVMAGTSGRLQFHTRVAVNLLSVAERELAAGESQASAHNARLDAFGAADDAGLANLIRSGALDERLGDVRKAVLDSVMDKLAVANPKYSVGRPGTASAPD
jgi:Domain of unknown function (DUF6285)